MPTIERKLLSELPPAPRRRAWRALERAPADAVREGWLDHELAEFLAAVARTHNVRLTDQDKAELLADS
jgi:hypothetical protein